MSGLEARLDEDADGEIELTKTTITRHGAVCIFRTAG